MLEPHEYWVGKLQEAPAGSLVLPRTKHEQTFLVGFQAEKRVAILLDGQYRFGSMECDRTENWAGLIVPDVRILADPKSLTEGSAGSGRAGLLVRLLDKLSVWGIARPDGFRDSIRIDLISDLSPCGERQQAGFLHWQVVIGQDTDRRVLFDVDLREPTQAA